MSTGPLGNVFDAPPSSSSYDTIDQLAINVLRGLAMDAPQKANSGHSGTAMALAPLAHVLWTRVMNFDAESPEWFDRDRFVLSPGHASILLYSLLYLSGYGLELDDLEELPPNRIQNPRVTPSAATLPALK